MPLHHAVQAHPFPHAPDSPLGEVVLNTPLWQELGLDTLPLNEAERRAWLLGQPPQGFPTPTATVYSGWQFGHYVPQLGDGRALFIGEVQHHGQHTELQLKGAGRTPFSRMGDGFAVLRSSIREFLASEAMAALGIPTTRALALIHIPQQVVYREEDETAAVVCRTAESFLRFGHVQFYHHRGEVAMVEALLRYAMEHHYANEVDPLLPWAEQVKALGLAVTERTAHLVAHWQAVGFCHGVLNTDNLSLLGLTLDYGPYGFLDAADFTHICNHSDHYGRYAYSQQPPVVLWNLLRLSDCFAPWLGGAKSETLEAYQEAQSLAFEKAFYTRTTQLLQAKFGLNQPAHVGKAVGPLLQEGLKLLHQHRPDYTLFFRRLGDLAGISVQALNPAEALEMLGLPASNEAVLAWWQAYQAQRQLDTRPPHEQQAAMHAVNPALVCRNYLAQTVIESAEQGDWQPFYQLWQGLQHPYSVDATLPSAWYQAPPVWSQELCVSCSS